MINQITSSLNRLAEPLKENLKIVTFPTHEGYQTSLGKTGHEFYLLNGPGIKTWDYHTRSLPENHYMYLNSYEQMIGSEHYDLILCQDIISQFDLSYKIARANKLPLIVLHHTEPPPNISEENMNALRERRGHLHVFITEHNKISWGLNNRNDTVINHGIDTNVFNRYQNPPTKGVVSLVNKFADRDIWCGWNLWNDIRKDIDGGIDLIGDNPGLSDSIQDPTELARTLSEYSVFLNTSLLSPCPLSLLEAAACGLPIVSTAHQNVPKIFTHGENALLSNNKDELVQYCKDIMNDNDLRIRLGNNARQLIQEKYSLGQFVDNWNYIFKSVYRSFK